MLDRMRSQRLHFFNHWRAKRGRNAGKKTMLRDLLHRRSDHYTKGELVTREDMSWAPSVKVKQGMVDSYVSFLEGALADVWIGHKLCSLRYLCKLVCAAHRLKTDVILCPHNALDIPACIHACTRSPGTPTGSTRSPRCLVASWRRALGIGRCACGMPRVVHACTRWLATPAMSAL